MYAITTNYTKSSTWGKRECTVYYIQDKDGDYCGDNVTNEIAEKYGFKQNKRWNIVIHCWSGTWYMVISEALKKEYDGTVVLDTSIF